MYLYETYECLKMDSLCITNCIHVNKFLSLLLYKFYYSAVHDSKTALNFLDLIGLLLSRDRYFGEMDYSFAVLLPKV